MLTLLYDFSLEQAIVLIGDMVIDLGIKISAFYFVIGLADYIYQKFKFKRDLRMTKQEIKEEYKNQFFQSQLATHVSEAIDNNHLALYYQQVVDVGKKVSSVEVVGGDADVHHVDCQEDQHQQCFPAQEQRFQGAFLSIKNGSSGLGSH